MTIQMVFKAVEEISKEGFKEAIRDKPIRISHHALDHLSESQRKVFKVQELLYMVRKESPRKVFFQENGRYAPYYRRKDGYRKLIIQVGQSKATIVSFIDTVEIPKIRLK